MHHRSVVGIGGTTDIRCWDHMTQQRFRSVAVEPGSVGLVGAKEIASETECIDAEAMAFITGSADETHPLICEQKVVRLC